MKNLISAQPKRCFTKASVLGANGIQPARRKFPNIECVSFLAILLIGAASGLAQSGVHRFGAITSQLDRTISLELLGDVPPSFLNYFDLYPLEASTNLADWTPLWTLVRTNRATNALGYLDADASGFGHRFYRIPTNHFFTALAKPSGPYAVGRTTRVLTDTSRTNRYLIATNSSFMITIWYPAEPAPGVLPGAYIDSQLAVPVAEPHLGSSGDDANRLAKFVAFSRPNVPVALAGSPYPIVIYSHGYTFHRQESSEKLEELASHGFVAVAMDHIDCRTTVYPDGTAVRGIFTDPPTQLAIDTAVAGRLADDRFVLEALAQLNASDALLAGRLDLNKLGAMGWSLGNSDLGELAQMDARFKGIVMLEGYLQGAPGLFDHLLQQGLRLPLLAMYQEDFSYPPLFDQAISNATQDEYFSLVHVTSHFAFKDLTELSLATDSVRSGAAAMRACMLSFFNKYLKGQDDHLLDNPTNAFPVLFNFVRTN
jgi:dienelactone hydrolase